MMETEMILSEESEWADFTNALKLYGQIEKLHNLFCSGKFDSKENLKDVIAPDELDEENIIRPLELQQNEHKKRRNSMDAEEEEEKEEENKEMKNNDSNECLNPSMYKYDVFNYYKDETHLKRKIIELSEEMMKSIEHIYDIFRISKDNVFLCFNGGKDAVVTLHLFRCAYAKYINDRKGRIQKPKLIYFKQNENEFPEISQFLKECVFLFDFHFYTVDGNWKEGVITFVQQYQEEYRSNIKLKLQRNVSENSNQQTNIEMVEEEDSVWNELCNPVISFVMGTRIDDPHTDKMHILNMSSRGLPPYLYLNPIFYWSYGAIWTFILFFKINYCILYDHGYSSIGSIHDTIKNEYLKWNGCYLPAYFLKYWKYERFNRIIKKRKLSNSCKS